ncbi:hypothetical protein [Arthrobacter crystallopoietes]|uniref:hypothetical protein n=1 Tax=Crystallibacter crystallopoietes TaxID=37928 RepID=UPI001ABE708D|nr:hypothetical protein [Arthrobacter crystallopoietes]QTG82543.1 hypothetical protein J5251_08450 [Arthrobacter crystallopoietes]
MLLITALAVPFTCTMTAGVADSSSISEQGLLPDGTLYSLIRPVGWNGTTIVMPGREELTGDVPRWLGEQGYGVIGYELSDNWNLAQDRSNASSAVDIFSETAGIPNTVILSGRSQGGLVTRIVTDAAPAWLDGSVPMCGGGAGAISMWNTKLDSAFALRELVGPDSQMSITRIQDERGEQAAMNGLVSTASATNHGQARIVLAAALSKIPAVDAETGEDVPAANLDKRIAEYTDAMPLALGIGVRAGFEQTVGGSFSWNHGVDYRKELKASGRWSEVQRAYREAGADMEADLQTLANAPRITADQIAVSTVERLATFTGNLEVPVLSLHTTGDPAGATAEEEAYADSVRAAGDNHNLRQTFVGADGHCTFSTAEQITAIKTVADRIENGHWVSTSPRSLARTAKAAQEATTIKLGTTRFTTPHPALPGRPWDVRNWDSYVPAE